MELKKNYIEFCKINDVPLFFQPFWLNMIDENWHVISETIDQTTLLLVYSIEKKYFFKFIRNGHLTPYGGFIFIQKSGSTNEELQLKLIESLLNKLPSYSLLNIDLHPTIQSLPSNLNCSINKRKTNILALENKDNCYKNLKSALQRQIKKAQKNLSIFEKDDVDLFYQLHIKTFEKNNEKPPTPFNYFQKAWSICKQNNCGKLLFIKDELMNIHATLFLVYDKSTSYYLAGGTDVKFYGSGAMSLLMWHAIEISFDLKKHYFDFEGSDIPSVDNFFKNYNPTEIDYFQLQKTNSFLLKLLNKK